MIIEHDILLNYICSFHKIEGCSEKKKQNTEAVDENGKK